MTKSVRFSTCPLLTACLSAFLPFVLPVVLPAQQLPLMPFPASVTQTSGVVPIGTDFSMSLQGAGSKDKRVVSAVDRLFPRLARQTGIPLRPNRQTPTNPSTLTIVVEQLDHASPQRLHDDERYSLESAGDHIRISADKPLGAVRGIETFLQLVMQNRIVNGVGTPGFSVAAVTIHDEPRFPWRGLSLDVARHFMPLDVVRRTIDGLAAVKLNVLHLHLSDDEGFRVESQRFPRLQQFGSDGLFYTQVEIRDLLAYARDCGVRIVPEFDMPGHATSWLAAYPTLGTRPGPYQITRNFDTSTALIDPTKESTYRFLDGFIGEMAALFPDEYFHIGGDEVNPQDWQNSAGVQVFMRQHQLADPKALQTYFNRRVLTLVTKHGKHMEGWDEILQPDLPKSIVVQSWRGQPSLWQGARAGFQGILSAGYYLDLIYPASYHYAVDPMKAPPLPPGHWGEPQPDDPAKPKPGSPSGLTPDQARLILGGEAAMWDELATPENLDAKLWPRVAAIAERFWSPESVTDFPSMYRRLRSTNQWLEWLGLGQRANLERMRQRLSAAYPHQALDRFASFLEPVKGYSRNAETYTAAVPLHRLVDAIAPESDAAREFTSAVDAYLAGSRTPGARASLEKQLRDWSDSAEAVRQMCAVNSILAADLPVVNAAAILSRSGIEALSFLDGAPAKPAKGWQQRARSSVAPFVYQRLGDLVVPVAPAVQKLINAVPSN